MNAMIGIGILGFAHGHVQAYCDAWKEPTYGVRVLAGWDHDKARLQSAAEKLGIDSCDEADDLLKRADIEAVVIASETSLHAELTERAAAAGKTVILQKPLALTMAEADRIVNAVRKHGIRFTLAWQMRVDPQNLELKEWLDSGRLGQVFMVRRRHGLPMGLQAEFADSWHVDPALNRDIWADDTSHPADFLHFLLGAPETVTAEVDTLYNPRIPMDNGIAIYRYPGGPIAEICCSFTCTAAENTMEIIGEKGSIVQNYGDVPSCNVPRPEGALGLKRYDAEAGDWTAGETASPPNHGHRIRGLAGPLAAFLKGEREAIATAEEGRISLRMVLASYVSAREGRRVRLDDPAIELV